MTGKRKVIEDEGKEKTPQVKYPKLQQFFNLTRLNQDVQARRKEVAILNQTSNETLNVHGNSIDNANLLRDDANSGNIFT